MMCDGFQDRRLKPLGHPSELMRKRLAGLASRMWLRKGHVEWSGEEWTLLPAQASKVVNWG